ncbi:MAG: hypothetical protein ABIN96_09765 [Rubrivivax sp.]
MPLDTALCLDLAGRIDLLLQQSIGVGIEPERLLQDSRYARDVLLVCDALDDGAGPQLARDFRAALGSPADAGLKPVRRTTRAERQAEKRRNGLRDRRMGRGRGSAPGGRERRRALRRQADAIGGRAPAGNGAVDGDGDGDGDGLSPDTVSTAELTERPTGHRPNGNGKDPRNGAGSTSGSAHGSANGFAKKAANGTANGSASRADEAATAPGSTAGSAPSALRRWFSRRPPSGR